MKNNRYKTTINACFIGFIVQAITNNYAPLLFVNFEQSYGISLSKITLLITINFLVQLAIDALSMLFVDRIGYRTSMLIGHMFSFGGLISMAFLPDVFSDSFIGLLIAVIMYAIGSGLLEVLISPIMESCPNDNKEKAMSLLHSFYCWGHVGVVLISTIYFSLFGIKNWKYLTLFWALVPLTNALIFTKAPIPQLVKEEEQHISLTELLRNKLFWLLIIMMVCAGASEQAVSQWASTFAEKGLNISKSMGDLLGPMSFAILMGTSRSIYGNHGEKIEQHKFMIFSTLLCIASYLIIPFSKNPIVSLLGCGICGFSVGIMWPGTLSNASVLKNGGTALYALLAFAGDIGCSTGPALAGYVSNLTSGNLKAGILSAIVFPVILLIALLIYRHKYSNSKTKA
ncbi:MAG: MFS transporter [Erysipelotrichaceae bacterium]|nr:MFS transporter [Erysipelotrichaceae bacterium]